MRPTLRVNNTTQCGRAVRGDRFDDPARDQGVGELAITGMAAAIANAVYHPTGTRIRSLPISIEKMLGHESATSRMSSSLEAIAATTTSARNDGI